MIYVLARKHIKERPLLLRITRIFLFIGRLGPWRVFVMNFIMRVRPNPIFETSEKTIFDELKVPATVDQLNNFGYFVGAQLPDSYCDEIMTFFQNKSLRRFENPHRDCQSVDQIARDPVIVQIVRKYLGVEPVLFKTCLYSSLPTFRYLEKRDFHYDAGDFKGLTIFIYLTDVDEESSPHILIENTHRKGFRDLVFPFLSYPEAEIKYGDRIKMITGKKGTMFFEDLNTYHQRSFGRKERIVLTISYLFQRKPD